MPDFTLGDRVRFDTERTFRELHGLTGVIVEVPGLAGFDCEVRLDGENPYPKQETIGARFSVLKPAGSDDA